MFYSAVARGFYCREIHGEEMPPDVVAISDEQYAELVAGQALGKLIESDKAGFPRLVDPPPATSAQLAEIRRAAILAELDRIDLASARPLRAIVAGSATDEDRTRLEGLDQQAAALRLELSGLA